MTSKDTLDLIVYGLLFVGYVAIIDCHVRNKCHIVACYIFIALNYLALAAFKAYDLAYGVVN